MLYNIFSSFTYCPRREVETHLIPPHLTQHNPQYSHHSLPNTHFPHPPIHSPSHLHLYIFSIQFSQNLSIHSPSLNLHLSHTLSPSSLPLFLLSIFTLLLHNKFIFYKFSFSFLPIHSFHHFLHYFHLYSFLQNYLLHL